MKTKRNDIEKKSFWNGEEGSRMYHNKLDVKVALSVKMV